MYRPCAKTPTPQTGNSIRLLSQSASRQSNRNDRVELAAAPYTWVYGTSGTSWVQIHHPHSHTPTSHTPELLFAADLQTAFPATSLNKPRPADIHEQPSPWPPVRWLQVPPGRRRTSKPAPLITAGQNIITPRSISSVRQRGTTSPTEVSGLTGRGTTDCPLVAWW